MLIEVLTFCLADGVDEDAFLEADRRMQTEFAYAQPGLVRRTTARGADDDWLVLTLWGSSEDADGAAARAEEDDVARAFADLIEETSVQVHRYAALD